MKAIFLLLVAGVVVFFGCLIGTLIGALAGWVVGLVFPETLALLASVLSVSGAPAWQVGAMLGFVGGFFRSSSVSASSKE